MRDYRHISKPGIAGLSDEVLKEDREEVIKMQISGEMDDKTANAYTEAIDRGLYLKKYWEKYERNKKFHGADDYFPEPFE